MNIRTALLARIAAWVLPAIVAACGSLSAQSFTGDFDRVLEPGAPPLQIGPYAGVTYSLHSGRFVTRERNIVCCEFNDGAGFGPAAGVRMSLSLGEAFFIAPAVGYESRGGTFDATPERLPILGRNNRIESVTMQSTLDVSLATLDVEALAGYRVGASGVYVTAGPAASVVLAQDYAKSERIVDPFGVTYADGTTVKALYDGDMGLVRPVLFAARGGVGAAIAIGDGISLNPQLLYSLPIGAASRADEWMLSGVHGTVAVLFDL